MSDAIDRELALLLGEAERPPDDTFVARINWAVIAEERMRAQKRALWRRVRVEAAATAALAGCYLILARAAPASAPLVPLSSPSLAGLLLLTIGMIVIAAGPSLKKADPH